MKRVNLKTSLILCFFILFFTSCSSTNKKIEQNKKQENKIIKIIPKTKKKKNLISKEIVKKQAQDIAFYFDTKINNNKDAIFKPYSNIIVSHTNSFTKVILKNELFKDEFKVSKSFKSKLRYLKMLFLIYPNMVIEIAGHSDFKAEEAFKKMYSEKKARAIRDAFINTKIKNYMFISTCMDKKVISLENKQRALNKRVELYFYPNSDHIISRCK